MENLAVLSLLAFLPILVIGILLVGLRWSARNAMAVGFVVVVVVSFGIWEVEPVATVPIVAAQAVGGAAGNLHAQRPQRGRGRHRRVGRTRRRSDA